jgi:GrpB-like predicted nucleotidyltransferase (UPF0157 family)
VIEVVEYDEAWPVRAAAAAAELAPLGVFGTIEHIGSTSVPGLAAKPIIDLMAAAASPDAVAAVEDALGRLGPGRPRPALGPGLGRVTQRADQPPSSRYEEPFANEAGAEHR